MCKRSRERPRTSQYAASRAKYITQKQQTPFHCRIVPEAGGAPYMLFVHKKSLLFNGTVLGEGYKVNRFLKTSYGLRVEGHEKLKEVCAVFID